MGISVDAVAKLVLAPVLIFQGLRVRNTALVLPEADGARAGSAGSGPRLRVMIAGDSSAAGVGVDHQDQALAGQLARALGQDFAVEWVLVAKTGATTVDVTQMLNTVDAAPFDVAVVCVGVNDVTRSVLLKNWLAQLEALLAVFGRRFGVGRSYISALPPIAEFPALPQPLRWIIGRQATRYEAARFARLGMRDDVGYLTPDFGMDVSKMASDGYHPGEEVYAMWAEQLAARIKTDMLAKN